MSQEKKQYRGDIIDNTDFIFRIDKAYTASTGQGRKFHKATYQNMKRLVKSLQYENVIYLHVMDWQELLGVSDHGNVLHKLRPLQHLIEVRSSRFYPDEVEKGFLKVLINPEYGWRVSQQKSRDRAIKEFRFLQDLSETSKKDITLSGYYQALKSSEMACEEIAS